MQKRKILALLLCVLLMAASVPGALADGAAPESGEKVAEMAAANSCGVSLYWSVNNSTLSITGSGAMFDYSYGAAPWYSERWNISSVTLQEGMTSIGASAFAGCSQIRSINIPATVTAIGAGAFDDCRNLEYISVASGNRAYQAVDGALLTADGSTLLLVPESRFGSYAVPNTVRNVEYSAFANCRYLTGVSLPSSVVSISGDAFSGCSSLSTISVAAGNSSYQAVDGALLTADGSALVYCPAGKSGDYTVPDTVREIQYSALADCSRLSSVTIPSSVVSIGERAFSGCSSLTDVYYNGSETQWKAVSVAAGNEPLLSARLHFDALLPEDLNGDGVISAQDAALLARYLKARGLGVVLKGNGDLNGDGVINGADLVRLARLLKQTS